MAPQTLAWNDNLKRRIKSLFKLCFNDNDVGRMKEIIEGPGAASMEVDGTVGDQSDVVSAFLELFAGPMELLKAHPPGRPKQAPLIGSDDVLTYLMYEHDGREDKLAPLNRQELCAVLVQTLQQGYLITKYTYRSEVRDEYGDGGAAAEQLKLQYDEAGSIRPKLQRLIDDYKQKMAIEVANTSDQEILRGAPQGEEDMKPEAFRDQRLDKIRNTCETALGKSTPLAAIRVQGFLTVDHLDQAVLQALQEHEEAISLAKHALLQKYIRTKKGAKQRAQYALLLLWMGKSPTEVLEALNSLRLGAVPSTSAGDDGWELPPVDPEGGIQTLCVTFMKGTCKKATCQYLHLEVPPHVCKPHIAGACKLGVVCDKEHVIATLPDGYRLQPAKPRPPRPAAPATAPTAAAAGSAADAQASAGPEAAAAAEAAPAEAASGSEADAQAAPGSEAAAAAEAAPAEAASGIAADAHAAAEAAAAEAAAAAAAAAEAAANGGEPAGAAIDVTTLMKDIVHAAQALFVVMGKSHSEKNYQAGLKARLEAAGCRVEEEVQIAQRFPRLIPILLDRSRKRCDLLVNETVIVELKHVRSLDTPDEDQLHSYLGLAGLHDGLLINFPVGPGVTVVAKRVKEDNWWKDVTRWALGED